MTAANWISLARIFLVPVFAWLIISFFRTGDSTWHWAAILVFALAAASDGIDGYVARRFNQQSRLGVILDPIGDKLLLLTALGLFTLVEQTLLPRIPLWVLVTLLARDLLLVAGLSVVKALCGSVDLKTRFIGKTSTVLQIGLVCWILLNLDQTVAKILMLSAAAVAGLSGLIYLSDGFRQITNRKKAG